MLVIIETGIIVIAIDIIRKKRASGNPVSPTAGAGVSVSSGSDTPHAVRADEADHAQRADEAAHAVSAGGLDGGSSVWNTIRTWISDGAEALKGIFLRKDRDDITAHKLTMGAAEVKGDTEVGGTATAVAVQIPDADGNAFKQGLMDGRGAAMYNDSNTRLATVEADVVNVRHKLVAQSVEIRHVSHVGGDQYFSLAGCHVTFVEPVYGSDGTTVISYNCYFKAKDADGDETPNFFKVGDQAYMKKAKASTTTLGMREFWRLVVAVDDGSESGTNAMKAVYPKKADGTDDASATPVWYHWIELSNQVLESRVTWTANSNNYTGIGYASNLSNDIPIADDDIAQLGSQTDPARRYAYVIYVTEGRRVTYNNIYDYNLTNRITDEQSYEKFYIASQNFKLITVSADNKISYIPPVIFRGDWNASATYTQMNTVTYNGVTYIMTSDTSLKSGITPAEDTDNWSVYSEGRPGKSGDYHRIRYALSADKTTTSSQTAPTVETAATSDYTSSSTPAFIHMTSFGSWSTAVPTPTTDLPYIWEMIYDIVDGDENRVKMFFYARITGEQGKNGVNGADGKGALRVEVTPATLVFDTQDNGLVDSSTLNGKTATVTVYRDNRKLDTGNLSLPSQYGQKQKTNVDGTIGEKDGQAVITVTSIETEYISGYGNISKSSGQLSFPIDVSGDSDTLMWATVNVQVNVSKFTGGTKADNKKFQRVYNELTNNGSSTDLTWYNSKIEQTARNISLKVGEMQAGRRNLLPGSALRKQDGGVYIETGQNIANGIRINGGYDGTNAVRIKVEKKDMYPGLFWTGSHVRNIKVERGKKYTLSFWAKRLSSASSGYEISSQFFLQNGETVGNRPYGALKFFSNATTEQNKWELITNTVTIPSDAQAEYVEVVICVAISGGNPSEILICRPMLEEGEEYNGWTLSEQDYDYVGGNLLDNTGTLVVGGNLKKADGMVMQGGMSESAVLSHYQRAIRGRVSTKTSLPSSPSTGDVYACTDTWMLWEYTGSEVTGRDYYNGWSRVSGEMLLDDIIAFVLSVKAGKDYVFSYYAKGDGTVGCYQFLSSGSYKSFVEHDTGDVFDSTTYGESPQALTGEWRRHWMHVRPEVDSTIMIYIRHYRADNNASEIHLSQPKLESGATMTGWTERHSDMVSKQALLETGVDIEDRKITLTSDNTEVRTNSGKTVAVFDENGIVSQGLKMKDANGNTVFDARNGDVSCKTGTFDNINVKNSKLTDVSVNGSIRSAFKKFSNTGENINTDNYYINTTGGGWITSAGELFGTVSDIGRTVKIFTNGLGGAEITLNNCSVYTEFGQELSSSIVMPGNSYIELLGIGTDDIFKYWQITNRGDVGKLNYVHGVDIPLLAYGYVEVNYSNGSWSTKLYYDTFDGSALTLRRNTFGYYILTLPSTWFFENDVLHVMTTPYGPEFETDGTRESVRSANVMVDIQKHGRNIVFICADDDTLNDQSFFFEIKNLNEMNHYHLKA